MILWLDAHLKPEVAEWITIAFGVPAIALRRLCMQAATDREVCEAARLSADDVVVMTKDHDFVERVNRFGPPPRVIWLTIGNTKTRVLKDVLSKSLTPAMAKLMQGAAIVEISQSN
jgi:predicted nuclease of predicted toxin-antitoxin system